MPRRQRGADDGAGARAQADVLVERAQLGHARRRRRKARRPRAAASRRRACSNASGRPALRCTRRPPGRRRLRRRRRAAEADRAAGLRLQRQRQPFQPAGQRHRLGVADRAHARRWLGQPLAQAQLQRRARPGSGAFVGCALHDGLDRRLAAPQVGAAQGADAGDFHAVSQAGLRSVVGAEWSAKVSMPAASSAGDRPSAQAAATAGSSTTGGSVDVAVQAQRLLGAAFAQPQRRPSWRTARPPAARCAAAAGRRWRRAARAPSQWRGQGGHPRVVGVEHARAVGQHHVDLRAQHARQFVGCGCRGARARRRRRGR